MSDVEQDFTKSQNLGQQKGNIETKSAFSNYQLEQPKLEPVPSNGVKALHHSRTSSQRKNKDSEVELWLESDGHKSYFPITTKSSFHVSNSDEILFGSGNDLSDYHNHHHHHHDVHMINSSISIHNKENSTPENQSQEKNNIIYNDDEDMIENGEWPDVTLEDRETFDLFEKKLMQEAEAKQKEPKFAERFTVADIAENPELAIAAKLELGRASTADANTMSIVESVASEAESRLTQLEQIRFNADSLDRDAAKETEAGLEDIDLLIKRMEHGKRSCMQLYKLIQRMHQAELTYSRSLIGIARTNVSNIGNTEGAKYISQGIGELPMIIGEAHSKISCILVEAESKLKTVLYNIKVVIEELVSEAQKINSSLNIKRSALAKALSMHEEACKKVDDTWDMRSKSARNFNQKTIEMSKASVSSSGADPWNTEAKVAHGYTQLIEGQIMLQKFLATSNEKVKSVETYRYETVKTVIVSLMKNYGNVFQHSVSSFTSDILKMLDKIPLEDEMKEINKKIQDHDELSKNLERQCSEEYAMRCGDLFSSPDIVRQGELEIFVLEKGKWTKGHFVLTMNGLYWFLGKNSGPLPNDSLNLSRSFFEQGEAPELKIVQESENFFGFSRSVRLKAPSVEDCCEWAIAIRETISKHRERKQR